MLHTPRPVALASGDLFTFRLQAYTTMRTALAIVHAIVHDIESRIDTLLEKIQNELE